MADERRTIFRPEAMEERGRRRPRGEVVRIAPRWTAWAFYALIGLVALALVAATVVDLDRYARGPTAVDGGKLVVLLPASLAPHVSRGRPVEVGGSTARVVDFRDAVVYPSEARARYGIDVSVPSVAVVTSAPAAAAEAGSARVLVESEPAIVALIPGLEPLFGGG